MYLNNFDKKILYLVSLNLFLHYIIILYGGYLLLKYSLFFIALFNLLFFAYKFGFKFNFRGKLALLIAYLIIYDSDFFTYTEYKIRVWYFLFLLGLFILILSFLIYPQKTYNYLQNYKLHYDFIFFFLVPLLILFFLSVIYLIYETSLIAKLYNIKYWLFYIGTIFFLYKALEFRIHQFILYEFYIILFVALFGISQFAFNILFGIDNIFNNPLNNKGFRPNGFFSETTWFSKYLLLGLMLNIFLYKERHISRFLFLLSNFIFLLGIFISVTRATLLVIVIDMLVLILLGMYKYVLYILSFFVISLLLLYTSLQDSFSIIQHYYIIKLFLKDDSAHGRFIAFRKNLELIKDNLFTGHGFYWDENYIIQISGTSIGAKSFNIFLMIFYILGAIGFLAFSIIVIYFLFKLWKLAYYYSKIGAKISLLIFLSFILLAFISPIHQYPLGIIYITLSILLYKHAKIK